MVCPLILTPRLPAVDWTDSPADLNGLVHFSERPNLVSARVPSRFKRALTPRQAVMTGSERYKATRTRNTRDRGLPIGKAAHLHAMHAHTAKRGRGCSSSHGCGYTSTFLTWTLDGNEWSASRSGPLYQLKRRLYRYASFNDGYTFWEMRR